MNENGEVILDSTAEAASSNRSENIKIHHYVRHDKNDVMLVGCACRCGCVGERETTPYMRK